MGRTSLKDARQEEIVIAFYELSKIEGLENASIAKTADRIGIAPSLILHYFKTKEQLIQGLVDYILNRYLQIFIVPVSISKHPSKKLLTILNNLFSHKWNQLLDDGVSYSCYALAIRNKTLKKKYRLMLETLREQLANTIQECNQNGSLDINNPTKMANTIFALVDGAYYYNTLIDDKKQAKIKLEEYKKDALALLKLSEQV